MPDNIQTNTKAGNLSFASANLIGKEGLLVKLTETGLALPEDITDITPYVVVDGGQTESSVKPLNRGEQVRIFLKGICAQGALLMAADPATPDDAGKVRALPSTTGSYEVIGIAEESGEDGQAVLVRAFNKTVVIS